MATSGYVPSTQNAGCTPKKHQFHWNQTYPNPFTVRRKGSGIFQGGCSNVYRKRVSPSLPVRIESNAQEKPPVKTSKLNQTFKLTTMHKKYINGNLQSGVFSTRRRRRLEALCVHRPPSTPRACGTQIENARVLQTRGRPLDPISVAWKRAGVGQTKRG